MSYKDSMDGNTAAAHVAYAFTEIASIYPITPSSTMAEVVDDWAAHKRKNIFGDIVTVQEMQSEAGAAGAVHGALKAGALTTTFTASQGLLLMIPNMYKIAGELLPTVFHVSARAIATNALSIFGDHSDIYGARQTGFAMLCEDSVQEVMDLSPVAHLATLKSSVPFINFFDGFRTSHEIQKIDAWDYDELKDLFEDEPLQEFRNRALSSEKPSIGGTNQNGDTYFQQRETVNAHYLKVPEIVRGYMKAINKKRGTDYDLINYYGDPNAESVIVAMGSVNQVIEQTIDYLAKQGKKVGLMNVRLYRPFPDEDFKAKLPKTCKNIAVLDRTKEPGSLGEPLLQDVLTVLYGQDVNVIGGRYGIGSKNVTPNQILAVYNELDKPADKRIQRFTVGINEDVTNSSLELPEDIDLVEEGTFQGKFWGFGSDGTVGANKSSCKIIGNHTDKFVQAYFDYDSKKSGGRTTSHLRFGDLPIRSTNLIDHADFVSCSLQSYVYQYDLVGDLKEGGSFLLNTVWDDSELDEKLPAILKQQIADKHINFYTVNAVKLAREVGLGGRTNTILQAAFFSLADIMPYPDAVKFMKEDAEKAYARKSMEIVEKNWAAIDKATDSLHKVEVPAGWANAGTGGLKEFPESAAVGTNSKQYIEKVLTPVLRQQGDRISVQEMIDSGMLDGTIPVGTSSIEKRSVSAYVPNWLPDNCIQCNQCAFVCPHAAIRPFLADESEMKNAPEGYITKDMRGADGLKYRIQVSIEDCTGCGLCLEVCPAKEKALVSATYEDQIDQIQNWVFAMTLKQKANPAKVDSVLGSQFEQPLLEFSGACAGCGETPYVKLLTQMFGSRMVIANATGCSSIWGGAFPSSPYTTNSQGYGPAWCNSLFEDNAEFGMGIELSNSFRRNKLMSSVNQILGNDPGCAPMAGSDVSPELTAALSEWLEGANVSDGNRDRAEALKAALEPIAAKTSDPTLKAIWSEKELFAKNSNWILGGDGWAYDIGYGGLDHVIASGENVNILVFDNEVYSNTGGQRSKATPAAAIAKFAAAGNRGHKKDLGQIAISYKNVYVAQIAWGANQQQTINAFKEAEAYDGPSIVIGYTACILHGLQGGMGKNIDEQKEAVNSGYWSLYRYNPDLLKEGKNPMKLDFKKPDFSLTKEFMMKQSRFAGLKAIEPELADTLYEKTVADAKARFDTYAFESSRDFTPAGESPNA